MMKPLTALAAVTLASSLAAPAQAGCFLGLMETPQLRTWANTHPRLAYNLWLKKADDAACSDEFALNTTGVIGVGPVPNGLDYADLVTYGATVFQRVLNAGPLFSAEELAAMEWPSAPPSPWEINPDIQTALAHYRKELPSNAQ